MPLAAGNTWVYRTVTRDTAGTIVSESFDTLRVDSVYERNGEPWFHISPEYHPALNKPDGTFFCNRADGLSQLCCGQPKLSLKYPAHRNEVFAEEHVITCCDVVRVATRVLATDMLLTAPPGRYRVYGYERNVIDTLKWRLRNTTQNFYAPDVGCVLIIPKQTPRTTTTLVAYTLH